MPQAQKVLRRDPDCFRAIDMMCQVGGINDLHVTTTLGPQILDRVLPAKLRMLDELPASVGQAIDGRRGEPALVEALRHRRRARPPTLGSRRGAWSPT